MIVILARETDSVARSLAAQWGARSAALLTPGDLSSAGWRHAPVSIDEDVAVVSQRKLPATAITGILTRLRCVSEHDLVHVVPDDRAYVAAEMTAFLLSWLAGLDCPLLNRPTPTCLSGPGWRAERWVHLASRLGIPVCPVSRHTRWGNDLPLRGQRSHETVTVIGGQCLETVDAMLANHARRLAAAATVDLLRVHFSEIDGGPRFLDADPCPDISSVQAAAAVHEYLSVGGRVAPRARPVSESLI